ncbi:MAG: anti-sigma factor [Clostridia bacterium]|nr:anti-sigma factor [Clostridia bacterium]
MDKNEMNNESCESLYEAVSAYADGELSNTEAERVKSHLLSCPRCKELYDSIKSLSLDIKESEISIPVELHESIMGAVASLKEKEKKTVSTPRFAARVRKLSLICGAGIAAMICLMTVALPLLRGNGGMEMMRNGKSADNAYYSAENDVLNEAAIDNENGEAEGYSIVGNVPNDVEIDGNIIVEPYCSSKSDKCAEKEQLFSSENSEECAETFPEISLPKTEDIDFGLIFMPRGELGERPKKEVLN